MTQYGTVFGSDRITVVDDPLLGASRQVLQMAVLNTDTDPTADPRAQVQPPANLLNGDTFWFGYSLLLPAGFPVLPGDEFDFFIFSEVYGNPASGAAPLRLGIFAADDRLTVRNAAGVTLWSTPVVRDQWFDLAFQVGLSTFEDRGFYEMWMNTGGGWIQQMFDGEKRLRFATLGPTNWQGPNSCHLKNYRKVDMFSGDDDPVTVYFGSHKVGPSLDYVDPGSYA